MMKKKAIKAYSIVIFFLGLLALLIGFWVFSKLLKIGFNNFQTLDTVLFFTIIFGVGVGGLISGVGIYKFKDKAAFSWVIITLSIFGIDVLWGLLDLHRGVFEKSNFFLEALATGCLFISSLWIALSLRHIYREHN